MAGGNLDAGVDLNSLFSEAATDEGADPAAVITEDQDTAIQRFYADIIWASENIGGRMSRKRAGSARRFEFWKYATNSTAEFLAKYMPRAADFLVRQNKETEPLQQEVEQEETRDIAELQRFLRQVVRAASAE